MRASRCKMPGSWIFFNDLSNDCQIRLSFFSQFFHDSLATHSFAGLGWSISSPNAILILLLIYIQYIGSQLLANSLRILVFWLSVLITIALIYFFYKNTKSQDNWCWVLGIGCWVLGFKILNPYGCWVYEYSNIDQRSLKSDRNSGIVKFDLNNRILINEFWNKIGI